MIEACIGVVIIGSLVMAVYYIHKHGLHLSPYDRAIRAMEQCEGFNLNPGAVTLIKISQDPVSFVGYALDDGGRKLLCFNGGPGLICEYDQILEWRVLVNNRTVACLSRLSSVDLKVNEPDKDLSTDDFLRRYCDDQRQDPLLESVYIKLLIRNLSYPVHYFSMQDIDQGSGDVLQALDLALSQIDKFKIVMYRAP